MSNIVVELDYNGILATGLDFQNIHISTSTLTSTWINFDYMYLWDNTEILPTVML
jgi:hypothetical protein